MGREGHHFRRRIQDDLGLTGLQGAMTFFAKPFGEMEILALAKAHHDAAGFHLTRPPRLDS